MCVMCGVRSGHDAGTRGDVVHLLTAGEGGSVHILHRAVGEPDGSTAHSGDRSIQGSTEAQEGDGLKHGVGCLLN
jgi:hypothetical protein